MAGAAAREMRERRFKSFTEATPELHALSDLPLERREAHVDGFSLRYRVGPVYNIIGHPDTEMPLTIGIYGDWGTGKTSAMRWLHGRLEVFP